MVLSDDVDLDWDEEEVVVDDSVVEVVLSAQ